jgi:hypothetical protein
VVAEREREVRKKRKEVKRKNGWPRRGLAPLVRLSPPFFRVSLIPENVSLPERGNLFARFRS